jgi:antitoxin FitA
VSNTPIDASRARRLTKCLKEEEARRILKDAVSAPDCLGDLALRIFGPEHGVDMQLPERTLHEPLGLTE